MVLFLARGHIVSVPYSIESLQYLVELDLPLTGTNYFLTPVSENQHRTMTPSAWYQVRSFELGTILGLAQDLVLTKFQAQCIFMDAREGVPDTLFYRL